jgi:uncharacterized protein YecT (DUF1311 family)
MYEAEYQKALVEVKASEIELQNTKDLSDKNVVSKMNGCSSTKTHKRHRQLSNYLVGEEP